LACGDLVEGFFHVIGDVTQASQAHHRGRALDGVSVSVGFFHDFWLVGVLVQGLDALRDSRQVTPDLLYETNQNGLVY
jgi:hypothetical protein